MLGRKLTVVFDIDDVLIPIAAKIHEASNAAGLNPHNKPMTQWNMYLDYGCTADEWYDVFASLAVPDGMYHGPPYPGVCSSLAALAAGCHDIHLVTARGFHAHADEIRQWTREWKEHWNLPGTLHFSHSKGQLAQALGATHAIDDAYHNVVDLEKHGVETYLRNQPHNQNVGWPTSRRVDHVHEFVERIMG